jgi:uncharacterized membrane protein YkoI
MIAKPKEVQMKRKIASAAAVLVALAATGAGIAAASGGGSGPQGLDDGKQLAPQAKIGLAQAIAAAQTKSSGKLNEADLEHRNGSLVYNIDVGSHDVKVDAATGNVVAVDSDD